MKTTIHLELLEEEYLLLSDEAILDLLREDTSLLLDGAQWVIERGSR